jgi:hypothetical protein
LASAPRNPRSTKKGEREIWLDERVLNRLGLMRAPGESYSDAILRLEEGDRR